MLSFYLVVKNTLILLTHVVSFFVECHGLEIWYLLVKSLSTGRWYLFLIEFQPSHYLETIFKIGLFQMSTLEQEILLLLLNCHFVSLMCYCSLIALFLKWLKSDTWLTGYLYIILVFCFITTEITFTIKIWYVWLWSCKKYENSYNQWLFHLHIILLIPGTY